MMCDVQLLPCVEHGLISRDTGLEGTISLSEVGEEG